MYMYTCPHSVCLRDSGGGGEGGESFSESSENDFFFSKVFFLLETFTCPVLGPLVPVFRISGGVSSGFQSQIGFYLIHAAE